jgi:hypothetical protein
MSSNCASSLDLCVSAHEHLLTEQTRWLAVQGDATRIPAILRLDLEKSGASYRVAI